MVSFNPQPVGTAISLAIVYGLGVKLMGLPSQGGVMMTLYGLSLVANNIQFADGTTPLSPLMKPAQKIITPGVY
jgi:hypothetical protein